MLGLLTLSTVLSSVLVVNMGNTSLTVNLPIKNKTEKGNKIVETNILLDTGAEGMFMNQEYAKKHGVILHKLWWPITPQNVDGTENQAGKITYFTWIQTKINGRKCLERLLISNIASSDIIFRLPWFKEYNPLIDWNTGKFQILKDKAKLSKTYREKLTRRIRDLKNLEIATIQMKPTNIPPPSPKKKTRKQTKKSIDPLSHPLIKELKVRRNDSLDWRERPKETKKEEIVIEANAPKP